MLFIFLGIMVGQFLYMCTLWLQHRRREYAYYIVHYIIFIYFLFGLSYPYFFSPDYIEANKAWFTLLQFQPLHIFNYYLYIKFAQYFLETKQLYPFHNRQAINMMKGVWVCTGVSLLSWLVFDFNDKIYAGIYLGLSVFLMIWAIRLVYLIYTMHTRQSGYLFKGSLLLSIGILCTYILISMVEAGVIPRTVAIFYPSVIGVLGEIYFVNAGLNYKASVKRKQLIRIQEQLIGELERNRVLLQEKERVRNDLSLELNKEIGLTLNGISLFAEHSLQRFAAKEINGVESVLNRIVTDSNKMVSSMNDIIWVLSADNDTMAKTIQRIQSFSRKACLERGIECEFTNGMIDTVAKMDMDQRRILYTGYKNYFLQFADAVKEKISVLIHARGDELEFSLEGVAGEGHQNGRIAAQEGLGHFQVKQALKEEAGRSQLLFVFKTHPAG